MSDSDTWIELRVESEERIKESYASYASAVLTVSWPYANMVAAKLLV